MVAISYLKCECCNGDGTYLVETTGNIEPYFQDFQDQECEECKGYGKILQLDEMYTKIQYKHGVHFEHRHEIIEATERYINGLTKRKEIILYSINALKAMGLSQDLYVRYAKRLDLVIRGIDRVKQYKQIISDYEANTYEA